MKRKRAGDLKLSLSLIFSSHFWEHFLKKEKIVCNSGNLEDILEMFQQRLPLIIFQK